MKARHLKMVEFHGSSQASRPKTFLPGIAFDTFLKNFQK